MTRRTTGAVWAAAALLWAGGALAQAKDPVAAEALFQEGRAAAKKGDFAAACPKFAESYRLDGAPGTLFNLADCEERVGKLASAWQHFTQVSQQLPAADERAAYARDHAASLGKRLPRLTVKLAAGAPAGAKVLRDGVEMGEASLGSALPLDPGTHTLVVKAQGRKDLSVEVSLSEGQSEQVTLLAGEPGSGSSSGGKVGGESKGAESKAAAGGGSSSPTAGYVLLGLGGASLVVGGITGAMVLGRKGTVDDGCDAQRYCSPAAVDAADSGKTLSTVSTVTFGLGLVGVGVGAYLVLTHKDESATTAVGPMMLPGGSGLRVMRSF